MTGPWWTLPLIGGAVAATTTILRLRHKNYTEFPAPTNAGSIFPAGGSEGSNLPTRLTRVNDIRATVSEGSTPTNAGGTFPAWRNNVPVSRNAGGSVPAGGSEGSNAPARLNGGHDIRATVSEGSNVPVSGNALHNFPAPGTAGSGSSATVADAFAAVAESSSAVAKVISEVI